MWDLPWSGMEPMSPALAGGLFTIEPPETPWRYYFTYCLLQCSHLLFGLMLCVWECDSCFYLKVVRGEDFQGYICILNSNSLHGICRQNSGDLQEGRKGLNRVGSCWGRPLGWLLIRKSGISGWTGLEAWLLLCSREKVLGSACPVTRDL